MVIDSFQVDLSITFWGLSITFLGLSITKMEKNLMFFVPKRRIGNACGKRKIKEIRSFKKFLWVKLGVSARETRSFIGRNSEFQSLKLAETIGAILLPKLLGNHVVSHSGDR